MIRATDWAIIDSARARALDPSREGCGGKSGREQGLRTT